MSNQSIDMWTAGMKQLVLYVALFRFPILPREKNKMTKSAPKTVYYFLTIFFFIIILGNSFLTLMI